MRVGYVVFISLPKYECFTLWYRRKMTDEFKHQQALLSHVTANRFDVVKLCVDRGAFVSGECLVEGVSNAAMTKFLLEHGARLDGKNRDGLTALQVAAKNRTSVDTISLLLQYGADPNASDLIGRTCLHTSVSSRVISVLLRAGGDPNLKTKKQGMTALHYAAKRDDGDVICTLLANDKTRVNEKNEDGLTAYVLVFSHLLFFTVFE